MVKKLVPVKASKDGKSAHMREIEVPDNVASMTVEQKRALAKQLLIETEPETLEALFEGMGLSSSKNEYIGILSQSRNQKIVDAGCQHEDPEVRAAAFAAPVASLALASEVFNNEPWNVREAIAYRFAGVSPYIAEEALEETHPNVVIAAAASMNDQEVWEELASSSNFSIRSAAKSHLRISKHEHLAKVSIEERELVAERTSDVDEMIALTEIDDDIRILEGLSKNPNLNSLVISQISGNYDLPTESLRFFQDHPLHPDAECPNSIWSMEAKDFESPHEFSDVKNLVFEGWDQTTEKAMTGIETWRDLRKASDEVMGANEDDHHVFIEGYRQEAGSLYIITGS